MYGIVYIKYCSIILTVVGVAKAPVETDGVRGKMTGLEEELA